MKTSIKHENDEFLVITLKHVNHLERPKLWAIAHEYSQKCENDEFLVIPHKQVNRPGSPKLWAIAHENSHKMQKRRGFGHTFQTCKLPWNAKTVGNSSCKRPQNMKTTSFWS